MRAASPADLSSAARVLADAFHDDPIQVWLLPDERRRRARLQRVFRAELGHFHPLGRTLIAPTPEDDIGSVALWAPPGRWRTPPSAAVRLLLAYASTVGPRALAGLRLLREMDRAHPDQPHWYLGVLGTDPAHQGRGLASAVLEPVLRECAGVGVPAYLESSKEANVPFYERHGFAVVGVIEARGAPPVWRMWYEPGDG